MKSICVTGFYASGSSACLDYLSEYESTSFINGKEDYEHSMFYIGDGLFELYDRLYSDKSNYISRSHALNDYVDLVNNQYNNNFGWFGSYKLLLGENFKKISNDFINSISSKQGVAVDVADYYGVHFSLIKGLLQLGAHFIYKYKISKFGRKYKKTSLPTVVSFRGRGLFSRNLFPRNRNRKELPSWQILSIYNQRQSSEWKHFIPMRW